MDKIDCGTLFEHINPNKHKIAKGLTLLSQWRGRRALFKVNGRYYEASSENYTSQCGGRIIHIYRQPHTSKYEMVGPPDNMLQWHQNPFASDSNGILAVYVDCYPEDVAAFDTLMDGAVREIESYYSDLQCSLAKHRGDAYRNRKGTQRAVYILHTSNMYRHDGGEEEEEPDRECDCCGTYVDSDGYCSECEEYTMGEWYGEQTNAAADEEDSWMTGDREADMWDLDSDMDDPYFTDRVKEHGGKFMLSCDDECLDRGLAHSFAISCYGNGEVFIDHDHTAFAALQLLSEHLKRRPVFMSSNMGSPYGATPQVIFDLHKVKAELREEYGVDVVAPPTYATNPNEGDHYIDSLALVVEDMKLFEEVCREQGWS